jgi:hypothetical protein
MQGILLPVHHIIDQVSAAGNHAEQKKRQHRRNDFVHIGHIFGEKQTGEHNDVLNPLLGPQRDDPIQQSYRAFSQPTHTLIRLKKDQS